MKTRTGAYFAVLSIDDWEALVEWVEDLEDSQIVRAAFTELRAADEDRHRAGWLPWDEADRELA